LGQHAWCVLRCSTHPTSANNQPFQLVADRFRFNARNDVVGERERQDAARLLPADAAALQVRKIIRNMVADETGTGSRRAISGVNR